MDPATEEQPSPAAIAIDEQIQTQREAVALKRQALADQRLDIIKSQSQSWQPKSLGRRHNEINSLTGNSMTDAQQKAADFARNNWKV